jgi:hypothetical protein
MRLVRNAAMAAALLSLAAAPTSAQQWKWDWGINVGYSWLGNILDEEDTGLPDDLGGQKIFLKNGSLVGTQFTFWTGPKFGLRLNARYGSRDLKGNNLDDVNEDFDFVEDVNLWGTTLDGLIRFKAPQPEFAGMEMLPYLALGAGLKWHNPSGDNFTCTDTVENEQFACAPFTAGTQTFAMAEANNVMGLIGLGADWRLGRSLALRTEIGDRIWDVRVHPVTAAGGTNFNTAAGDDDVSDDIHEIYGQLGLTFLFGVARPVAVAVAPAPEPAPAPVTPAPEIRRESISVCVIDPTAPGGIRMQTATLIEGRDTVVTVSGTDRPLRDAVGNVMVASNADWYVRGQPLTMNIGTQKVEFATYGTARTIESGDLAFLGTVNGVPVYADRDEVQDVIEELNELNRAQRGRDLGKLLEEHKDLREDLEDVKVVYVPLYSTGCVFQGVQRQEEVRKGGK